MHHSSFASQSPPEVHPIDFFLATFITTNLRDKVPNFGQQLFWQACCDACTPVRQRKWSGVRRWRVELGSWRRCTDMVNEVDGTWVQNAFMVQWPAPRMAVA